MVLEQSAKRGSLKVVNPKYEFELQRAREDAPWAVAKVGKARFKPSTVDDPSYTAELSNRHPYTFAVIVFTMPVTVLDPGFSIKKVSSVLKDNQRLVKVDFDYSPPEDATRMPLRAGSVWFDPERSWTINSFDVQTQWGKDAATETADFEYDHLRDDFPILKQIVHRRRIPSRNVEMEFISQFELQESDVPERDFRLSAFGFPEPQGVVWDDRPRWYLWFIACGVLLLTVGGFFWRRAWRREA